MTDPRQIVRNIKRILTEDSNPIMEPLARRPEPAALKVLSTSEGILEAVKKSKKVKNKIEINPVMDNTIHPNG